MMVLTADIFLNLQYLFLLPFEAGTYEKVQKKKKYKHSYNVTL